MKSTPHTCLVVWVCGVCVVCVRCVVCVVCGVWFVVCGLSQNAGLCVRVCASVCVCVRQRASVCECVSISMCGGGRQKSKFWWLVGWW